MASPVSQRKRSTFQEAPGVIDIPAERHEDATLPARIHLVPALAQRQLPGQGLADRHLVEKVALIFSLIISTVLQLPFRLRSI